MSVPEETFAAVAEALLQEPGTEEGTGFTSMPGVKVEGKIAAMLVEGRLVVKLPADRCRDLVEEGTAEPFRMGKREMREWVAVGHGSADWQPLAFEALAFVRP